MWIAYKVFGKPGEVGVFSSRRAFLGIVLRGVTSGIVLSGISFSLYFGGLSGINMGVIASILTTAIFFTALIFYLVYGEKLSFYDWIGALLIMVGVAMIGLFTKNEESVAVDTSHLTIAVACAVGTAITIGFQSLM